MAPTMFDIFFQVEKKENNKHVIIDIANDNRIDDSLITLSKTDILIDDDTKTMLSKDIIETDTSDTQFIFKS